MGSRKRQPAWITYAAELVGTAVLVGVGLSVVILDFGTGSPVVQQIPSAALRRAVTGFLFGSIGALIALSPIGKESGAHINPVVTVAFYLMGKFQSHHAVGYVLAQLMGGLIGAVPLLAWGDMGRSVEFGATLPGPGIGVGWALLGEAVATWALVAGLFFFLRHDGIRPFTPALFPVLYAVMVLVEAPVSGTSTNPARSLGPAVISGDWRDWWVYWVGPLIGMFGGVALYRYTWLRKVEIRVAKLYHFDHNPRGVFSEIEHLEGVAGQLAGPVDEEEGS